MFTVGRRWENEAMDFFYFMTEGSELKKVAFSKAWNASSDNWVLWIAHSTQL